MSRRRLTTRLMRLVPLRVLGRVLPREVVGFCYHVVAAGALPHVRHLHPYKTPEQFEADLLLLLSRCRPVSYPELLEARSTGRALPRGAVLITFDDGYAECYDVVRPLLLRHGVPCTFFLVSDALDNGAMIHFNKLSLCLEAAERRPDEVGHLLARETRAAGAPYEGPASFAHWITEIDVESHGVLDRVLEEIGVDVARFLREERPYLTREQARGLAGDGFTLGGHTRLHAHIGSLRDPSVAEAEIVESCRAVAALTGTAAPVPFAFPRDANGVDRGWLGSVLARNPEVGLVFGTNQLEQDAPFLVNRILCDAPPARGVARSNLPGYFRGAYYDALAASRGPSSG